jgi:hypothetical protein
MRRGEVTVEVRDPELNKIGQVAPEYLPGATFILRFNNVGSWTIRFPDGDPLGDLLRTPGYGIVVSGPDDEIILSGPTLSASLSQSFDDFDGTWTISGADDSVLLAERLAFPEPTNDDVSTQSVSHDVRVGPTETVVKAYVEANLGALAPASRQVGNLVVGEDLERGEVVYQSARFNLLQDLVYGLAEASQFGYDIKQVDDELVFDIYEPVDRTETVRLDVQNEQLTSAEYAYSAPKQTRAIAGGQGEAVERLFLERATTASEEAETVWGRRIETFTDARQTNDLNELEQAAVSKLVESGATQVSMSVTPSSDSRMRFGIDWGLGDLVTVVAGLVESQATVTEVGISIAEDGIRVAAFVGDVAPLTFESKVVSRSNDQEKRVSALERNATGYGITTEFDVEGGTDDVQPTFSGDVFTATYTRFGDMIHFAYDVNFDNIVTFGTGQYFMTLPYAARRNYMFRDGCLHQASTGRQYGIFGHVVEGSNIMTLWTSQTGTTHDVEFTSTYPIGLNTEDNFHIAGTLEIEV